MAKDVKLYFKDKNGSFRNLKNFPNTYNFIAKNWQSIVESYREKNSDKNKIFAKVPSFTCSVERFEELQKDLNITDREFAVYYGSSESRIMKLTAKNESN